MSETRKMTAAHWLIASAIGAFCGAATLSLIMAVNLTVRGGTMDSASWILFGMTLVIYSAVFFVFLLVGVGLAGQIASRLVSWTWSRAFLISLTVYAVIAAGVMLALFSGWELLFAIGPAVFAAVAASSIALAKSAAFGGDSPATP